MVEIGYTLMGEQRSPKDMVRDLMAAERAGCSGVHGCER